MKKLFYQLLVLVFLCGSLNAQIIQVGNLGAGITSDGSLFRSSNGMSLFEAPYGSGLSTIFESHLWVGYQKNGVKYGIMPLIPSTLLGPTKTYGPHYDSGAYSQAVSMSKYNRTWFVEQDSVQFHNNNFQASGYLPPKDISQYIGSGDTSKGEFPFLMPFVNRLNDQNYTWQSGDYPNISGKKSQFALYSDRDVVKLHSNSTSQLNVSVELFEHNLTNVSTPYNNSVFVTFKVTNVGNTNIDSLFVGLLADFDIGVANNDYVGTDTTGNFIYGMNYTVPEPSNSYGLATPAMAVLPLSHNLEKSMRYNPGITQPSAQSMPVTFGQQFNFMKGIGPDNSVLPQYYAPGDPLTKSGILDDTLVTNFIDRGMLITLPIQNLPASQTVCFDFAYVVATGTDRFNSLTLLRQFCQQLTSDYYNPAITCEIEKMHIGSEELKNIQVKISPNPTHGLVNVSFPEEVTGPFSMIIYDLMGKPLFDFETTNMEQPLQLNLSNLAKGTYLIEIKQGNLSSYFERLIIL